MQKEECKSIYPLIKEVGEEKNNEGEEEDEKKDHFYNAEFRSLFCTNRNVAFP